MNYIDSFKKAKPLTNALKVSTDSDLNLIHYAQFYIRLPSVGDVTLTSNVLLHKLVQLPYVKYSVDNNVFIEVNKYSIPYSSIDTVKHLGNDLVEIYSFDLLFIYKKIVQTYKKEIRLLSRKKEKLISLKDSSFHIPYQKLGGLDSSGFSSSLHEDIDWSDLLVMKKPNLFHKFYHSFNNDIYKFYDKSQKKVEDVINKFIVDNGISLTYLVWKTSHSSSDGFTPSKSIITFDKFYLDNGCVYGEYSDLVSSNTIVVKKLSNCTLWGKISNKNLFFDFENNVPVESAFNLFSHRTWECFIFNYHNLDFIAVNDINSKMDNLVSKSFDSALISISSQITILEYDLLYFLDKLK